MQKKPIFLILPLLLCAFSLAPVKLALADDTAPASVSDGEGQTEALGGPGTDFLPVKTATETNVIIDENAPTDPAVNLTPDKSELIRLSRKASAVIVGNPAHLNIVPEGLNTLVLVPRAPGATYFTALDQDNKVIMQRHVIVASPKEKYVRISKTCSGNDKNCQATQVYYCPDMCHEIIMNTGDQKAPGGAAGKAAESAADASGSMTDGSNASSAGEAGADGAGGL